MEKEIIEYVRSCKVCQTMKARRGKAFGLLQHMPIPSRPWDVISMDFIVDLPPSKGYNTLMVVVDFFSKQAHFIPAKPPLTSNQVAQLFFKYILSIMDYQKSSCLTGILGSRVDFGKSCSRFWARNFVCQHRHILKPMDRLCG